MSKFQKYFTNLGIDVQKVLELEKFTGCSYVGQFPGARMDASEDIDFRDCAVDVFYQPNPNRELGHSNYFSIRAGNGTAYVANAAYVTHLEFYGIVDHDGSILYARYQHDFRYTHDGEFGVDGGWWFKNEDTGLWGMNGRVLGSKTGFPKMVTIRVKDWELVEV